MPKSYSRDLLTGSYLSHGSNGRPSGHAFHDRDSAKQHTKYLKQHEAGYDEGERASLINADRLEKKQQIGEQAAKIENRMDKTHEALNILGAGKPYGA